jgi:hypothetical protein
VKVNNCSCYCHWKVSVSSALSLTQDTLLMAVLSCVHLASFRIGKLTTVHPCYAVSSALCYAVTTFALHIILPIRCSTTVLHNLLYYNVAELCMTRYYCKIKQRHCILEAVIAAHTSNRRYGRIDGKHSAMMAVTTIQMFRACRNSKAHKSCVLSFPASSVYLNWLCCSSWYILLAGRDSAHLRELCSSASSQFCWCWKAELTQQRVSTRPMLLLALVCDADFSC